MAKKGQKFNKYSSELKEVILSEYFSGKGSANSLAEKFNVPHKTIETWIRKALKPEEYSCITKRGRPKKNVELDYKEMYEILKKYQAFIKAQREKK